VHGGRAVVELVDRIEIEWASGCLGPCSQEGQLAWRLTQTERFFAGGQGGDLPLGLICGSGPSLGIGSDRWASGRPLGLPTRARGAGT